MNSVCKSYNMACERKGRVHITRKCDIWWYMIDIVIYDIYSNVCGDGDAIQIENGDCDCCNHWKHHTFSSSVSFTSKKDKFWRSNKHQRNKKLSELSLFLVANSKREHTSDDINLMTLYMFANYINISQKLWCRNDLEVGEWITWSRFFNAILHFSSVKNVTKKW